MRTRLLQSILAGAAAVLIVTPLAEAAQTRSKEVSSPVLTLSAHAAPAIEFQHEIGQTRGVSRYNEIVSVVKNVSARTVTFDTATCSWWGEWAADTRHVQIAEGPCYSNSSVSVTLPPGGTYTRAVPVTVDGTIKDGESITFRLHFTASEPNVYFTQDPIQGGIRPVPIPLLNTPMSNPVTLVIHGDVADAIPAPMVAPSKVLKISPLK